MDTVTMMSLLPDCNTGEEPQCSLEYRIRIYIYIYDNNNNNIIIIITRLGCPNGNWLSTKILLRSY